MFLFQFQMIQKRKEWTSPTVLLGSLPPNISLAKVSLVTCHRPIQQCWARIFPAACDVDYLWDFVGKASQIMVVLCTQRFTSWNQTDFHTGPSPTKAMVPPSLKNPCRAALQSESSQNFRCDWRGEEESSTGDVFHCPVILLEWTQIDQKHLKAIVRTWDVIGLCVAKLQIQTALDSVRVASSKASKRSLKAQCRDLATGCTGHFILDICHAVVISC